MSDDRASAAGPRVLLTRDEEGCRRWAEELRPLGGRPIVLPCLEITIARDPALRAELEASLAGARWLVLTSARGVEAVSSLAVSSLAVSPPEGVRIAAVGPATAAAARRAFGRVDLVPEVARGHDLAEALWRLDGERLGEQRGEVVLATADRGRRDVEEGLAARGVDVRRFEVYETIPANSSMPPRELEDLLRRAGHSVTDSRPDAVALASPSAYEGLRNRARLPADLPLVTIGPTTSSAVREAGGEVAAEARRPSLAALYEAILSVHAGRVASPS